MLPLPVFDDQLLQDFMNGFYGYGNYSGGYWFVGMEEGGGNSFENIDKRLKDWDRRGRFELEDIADYHVEIGAGQYFDLQPKLQPTWNRLIRLALSADGQEIIHKEQVREYQQKYLGRHDSKNCLVELLPLPSPSLGHWLYAQHSKLPCLRSREAYMTCYAQRRATHLQQRIQECKPKAVVFYSVNPAYISCWNSIAGIEFNERFIGGDRMYIGKNKQTVFAIIYHPVARGIKNEYFHQVGRIIDRYRVELMLEDRFAIR
jgi:hypothetical protein